MLDKTGTITKGQPAVTGMVVLKGGLSEKELLRLAASVEKGSEHPLGEALVAEAGNQSLELSDPQQFKAIAGLGVSAVVAGHKVSVGNFRMMEQQNIPADKLRDELSRLQAKAQTAVLVAVDDELAGIISISDPIKEESRKAVELMQGMELEVVMLTGDNLATAKSIANQVGITSLMAEVLPGEKADKVKSLQQQGKTVAMVGDGVNDAPPAQAIWPGNRSGTDVAVAPLCT